MIPVPLTDDSKLWKRDTEIPSCTRYVIICEPVCIFTYMLLQVHTYSATQEDLRKVDSRLHLLQLLQVKTPMFLSTPFFLYLMQYPPYPNPGSSPKSTTLHKLLQELPSFGFWG